VYTQILNLWYSKVAPQLENKKSKSLIHPFVVKGHKGLTINPYQGCQHRCGYCYATYQWSPEFYDKVYAKSNAAEVLEDQLKSWKSEIIDPVMISSATDAYQPIELKYGLTRKCIQVLQKYGIPYYVFTKSTIISRDLELHKQYKNNCFVVWSITTSNEKIRRLTEPGTPPADAMFTVMKKFTENGICCGVNIDPILPLITDSPNHIEDILGRCYNSGVHYVSGAILRLRSDIWERMKIILNLLKIKDAISEYKRIFQFGEPLNPNYNIAANQSYSNEILNNLRQRILNRRMVFDFPDMIRSRTVVRSNASTIPNQLTLVDYM
jgi:DNA repair photolyase